MESPVPGPALAGRRLDPVDEAMRGFGALQMPELHEFLKRVGLTVGGTRLQRLQSIADNLRSGAVSTDTAFDYLDERRENGEQHLFLFRLARDESARLAALRDPAPLIDALARVRPRPADDELGDRRAVRDTLYAPAPREALLFETVVEAEEPKLAAAYWRGPHRSELFLKWVETRRWQRLVTVPQPVQQTYQERAVSFFRVDLAEGRAELRLQRLHPSPERPLEDEVAALRGQLASLLGGAGGGVLGVGPFLPVLVEPAMRRLLTSQIARVLSWQVDWIDSGRLGGGVDPALAQCLFRRHREFSALRLSAEWLFERPGGKERKVPVQLDGRTNEICFPKRCTAAEMAVVLDHVRERARRPLRVRPLQELAREDETVTPILLQIERELRGREPGQDVDLRRLAREAWLDLADVAAVAERLAERNPDEFAVRYRGRCEETRHLAELPGGGRLEARRWAEIPPTFQCRHDRPARYEVHPGPPNVDAVLEVHTRETAPAPLLRVQPALEKWFGKSRADRLLDGLAVLAFAACFVPIVLATTYAFLSLQSRFAAGGMLLALILGVPMALVYVLEAGAIVAVLGDPLTSRAQQLLGWILSRVSDLFQRRAADDAHTWPAKVHRTPEGGRGATAAGAGGATTDDESGDGDAAEATTTATVGSADGRPASA